MKSSWKIITVLWVMLVWISVGTVSVSAAVAEPTGDQEGKEDYRIIRDILEKDGEVQLRSGETYYIVKPILLGSNQKINASHYYMLTGGFPQ